MGARPLLTLSLCLAASGCVDYGINYGGGGMAVPCPAGTRTVLVGTGAYGMVFSPPSLTVRVNDTVCWTWASGPHSVVSGTSCIADNKFCSPANGSCGAPPVYGSGMQYLQTFASTGTFPYFCSVHCAMGMVGTITVVP